MQYRARDLGVHFGRHARNLSIQYVGIWLIGSKQHYAAIDVMSDDEQNTAMMSILDIAEKEIRGLQDKLKEHDKLLQEVITF